MNVIAQPHPIPNPKWQRRILYRGFLHTWIVLVEIDDVGGYGDVAVASHMIQVCPDPWYNHKMVIVNGMKCILISRMRGYLFFRQNQKICSTSKIIINPRGHKVAELMGPTKSPFLGSWHQFLMINSQVYQCVAQTILHGTLNSVKLLFVVNVLLCSAGLWFLVNLIIKIQRLMNWIGGFRPKLQEFFFLRCSLPVHPSQEGAVLIGWLLGAADGEFVIINNWRF